MSKERTLAIALCLNVCRDAMLPFSLVRLSDDEAIAAASVHAGRCLLIDDSVKNIVTAKKMGWCTVLIGKVERDTGNAMPTPAEADHHVSTIHEIVDVLPALFEANEPMAAAAAV
ncbi:hypothetical protein PPROV_000610200 [Pycnococcus provasolii]|uniref:Uncharacterized protein n=1 Tax=Pycnococcus provasolii TaxID=41880 RepID=A0A830HPI4_9CHLO|nr:hypothetical protein PPROV_000610200 [Pycnococcus provasolii]